MSHWIKTQATVQSQKDKAKTTIRSTRTKVRKSIKIITTPTTPEEKAFLKAISKFPDPKPLATRRQFSKFRQGFGFVSGVTRSGRRIER